MTRPHYAGRQTAKSAHVCGYEVVFTELASSGFETSDCRILAALIPQLVCIPAPYKMDSCLLKVSFNMPGLLKKFLSNNKLSRCRMLQASPR
jgi:hypothetical protein